MSSAIKPSLKEMLNAAIAAGASDVHLAPSRPVLFRHDGQLHPQGVAISDEVLQSWLLELVPAEQRDRLQAQLKAGPVDIDLSVPFNAAARFRANIFRTLDGVAACLRRIPVSIPTLPEIAAPEIVHKLMHLERGLVLVTGPTGSGKSTLLAAMMGTLNQTVRKHIITIEDPVEFIYPPGQCLISQRDVGRDTLSFARALKSALREDPDIIILGDMRDHETIGLALTAAETGHLVFGTLHTNSAVKSIDRILDVFPAEGRAQARGMLAGSLEAVIAQNLLRRPDGGRVAVREILVATPAIRNLIRENQMVQIPSMLQMGSKFGMVPLKQAVETLQAEGHLAEGEAERILARADIATK